MTPATPAAIVPLLTTKNLEKITGLSSRQILNLRDAGLLPFVRLGKRAIRFDPKDVQAFIDSRKSGGSVHQ